MALFNENNTTYLESAYPLFLGQPMALYDSIAKTYPELFKLYKDQKAQDWSEDEVNLSQSASDFETCEKGTSEVMTETIMWQWEADSVASQAIILLFAPFITNPELFAMMMKQSEIEVLHALTYSEIARRCFKNPKDVIKQIMENQEVLERSGVIIRYMRELEVLGAKYRLDRDSVDLEDCRRAILRAMFALIGLEGIEFISSFACTFALDKQGVFTDIGQLVQKIMLDEMLHTKMDFAVIEILLKDPVWLASFNAIKDDLKAILDEVVEKEERWSDYVFSGGRAIIGLNAALLKDWTYWNSAPIYDYFGIQRDFERPQRDPLPWMRGKMYPDEEQNANQEQTNTSYKLNTTVNDADDDEEFDTSF